MYGLLIPEVDLLHEKIRRCGFLREPRGKHDVVRCSFSSRCILMFFVTNILCPRKGELEIIRAKKNQHGLFPDIQPLNISPIHTCNTLSLISVQNKPTKQPNQTTSTSRKNKNNNQFSLWSDSKHLAVCHRAGQMYIYLHQCFALLSGSVELAGREERLKIVR